ncbi:pilus assembly protein TadG-related protein [Planctomicrobium sp. SH668]|uniref:pilus assembly protein TadG-related protein n=1 Tax=Planctomicrobium sp. SH668 TaxID=3448126 RepID=UPI003F5C166A
MVLAVVLMIGLLAAAAVSVDVGFLQVQKTRMQNAVDAAALAAAQEITEAVMKAPAGTADPAGYALESARQTAKYVAGLSGITVDPVNGVEFGQRVYNSSTKQWVTTWGARPANTVKVTARRSNGDDDGRGGRVRFFFGQAVGVGFKSIETNAIAYVQARDIVVCHDFSRSMNFDSHFSDDDGSTKLAKSLIVENLRTAWDDLTVKPSGFSFEPQYLTVVDNTSNSTTDATFRGKEVDITSTTNISRIVLSSGSGSKTYNYSGTTRSATVSANSDATSVTITVLNPSTNRTVSKTLSDNVTNFRAAFNLPSSYPYPGGSWTDYYNHCKNNSELADAGYRKMYGGLTFLNYTIFTNSSYSSTPYLIRSRLYPFAAIKLGHQILCDFLEDLSFDDRIGMVSYDSSHRVESVLNDRYDSSIPKVDITSSPVSRNYQAVNNLMKFKQCNYYSAATNMGGGLGTSTSLLERELRGGAQPTILLMTDGQSNTMDVGLGFIFPALWDWNGLFDYDGDGARDYYTTDVQKRYVLFKAKEAADKGFVLHTIGVGAGADVELLRAISWIGRGTTLYVPGGTSAEVMEAEMLKAFRDIASKVPPAKLLNEEGS